MSSSSSHATLRIQILARMEMPIFLCSGCRAAIHLRVSRTPKNTNRPFYMCSEKGVRIEAISQFPWSGSLSNTVDLLAFMQVKCFFLWVDALAHALMNELLEEHEEWLPILSRTAAAAARAPEEEMEGGAHIDREVEVELRRLNQKIRKLEDQARVPTSVMAIGPFAITFGPL